MIRDVRFRAFIGRLKDTYEVVGIEWLNNGAIQVAIPDEDGFPHWIELGDNDDLLEYSGHKDVDGTDIFEADIVEKVDNGEQFIVMNGYYITTDNKPAWGWFMRPINLDAANGLLGYTFTELLFGASVRIVP
jgi:hypothetical protein